MGSVLTRILLLVILISSTSAISQTIFKVRELSFEGGKYTSLASRDSYLNTPTEYHLVSTTAIVWNVDLICSNQDGLCFFWDNRVDGKASEAAYKYTSWEFSSGLATKYVDFYYWHHSQHTLEEPRPAKAFPVEDIVMIRLKFILSPRRY